MADVQQQLTDSQSGTVGFCPTTVASCDAASLLLCLLQRMADVQQQLTESQSGKLKRYNCSNALPVNSPTWHQ